MKVTGDGPSMYEAHYGNLDSSLGRFVFEMIFPMERRPLPATPVGKYDTEIGRTTGVANNRLVTRQSRVPGNPGWYF
jgi:hypothetical protein